VTTVYEWAMTTNRVNDAVAMETHLSSVNGNTDCIRLALCVVNNALLRCLNFSSATTAIRN